MDQQNTDISVLAGNSRVYLNNDAVIVVQAQLHAFDAALRFSRQCLDNGRTLPRLSVRSITSAYFAFSFWMKTSPMPKTTSASEPSPSVNTAHLPACR